MKKLFIVLLVSLFMAVIMASCAAKETKMVKENSPSAFLPKPIDDDWSSWLVGEWEGITEIGGAKSKAWTKIESGLNGQFLIVKWGNAITSEQIQKLKEIMTVSDEEIKKMQSFESLELHTIDPKTGKVIGYLFDSLHCVAKGTAERKGNKEIIEWQWSLAGQGASSVRITEKINHNKFVINNKYTLADGSIMEDRAQMTRTNKMVKESGKSSFLSKPVDDDWSRLLVGEWEGSGESDAGTGKGRVKIEFALNGQFLIKKGEALITEITPEQKKYLKDTLHATDEEIEKFQSTSFKEIEIFTIDSKTGETIGFLFDSLRCVAVGRGKREGNKEIINWVWSVGGQGTSERISEKADDNKLIVTERYTLPDGSKMEDKGEMTRKKTAAEK